LRWIVNHANDPLKLIRKLLDSRSDGRIKLYISQRILCLRRERRELFVGGSYNPLRGNQHVAAFARAADGHTLVIAAPVQIATLMRGALVEPIGPEIWRDDRLRIPGEPGRIYTDVFTGRALTAHPEDGKATLKLAEVFGDFPVAALLSSA